MSAKNHPNPISLLPCRSKTELTLFERVPELLHRENAAFIPPFPGSIAKQLCPNSVFAKCHGKISAFITLRNGNPVGRIAAIVNQTHNQYHQDRTGFFGFFESENDEQTAAALLNGAAKVLAREGLNSMRGPYNPSINEECGLLMNHHDRAPVIGLPWNPEYYSNFLLQAGLKKARTVYTLNLPMFRLELPARLGRIAERLQKRSNLTMRTMDLKKLESELEIVRKVYNCTLERNWGFVPMATEEMQAAAEDLRAIADPRLLLIGQFRGQDAGVAITLPNFNEILAASKKTPRFLRLLHILFLMKTRRIKNCRQTILGVVPEFRDHGLHAWLVHEQFRVARQYHQSATLGWVEDTNTEVLEICQLVGGEMDGEWAIFEKAIQQTQGTPAAEPENCSN